MFLQKITIAPNTLVADIVKENHRTADVFREYGIEYCCGGNWPLETVCLNKGLSFEIVKKELEDAGKMYQLPPKINYKNWNIDFIVNYIINIHHHFLRNSLPDTADILKDFTDGHKKQYPEMMEVMSLFQLLQKETMPHLKYEEEIIFPYIRQIAHAHENSDSYAKLLVKTLRKPLVDVIKYEEQTLYAIVLKIRQLTNNYSLPVKSCVSHSIALSRLKDLDIDLMQHIHLESEVLFPKALHIESELLK